MADTKSTVDIEKSTGNKDRVPLLCSQRWILSYIGFLGFGVVYALRVNISVAVVCMLKTINTTDSVVSVNESSIVSDGCVAELAKASHSNDRAELEWSLETKSAVLSSFFYGYIVTQVPGGWLADRYGGKRVLLVSLSLSSILTLLFPVCARSSIYLVYAIRVSLGLLTMSKVEGMTYPWWVTRILVTLLTLLEKKQGETRWKMKKWLVSSQFFIVLHVFYPERQNYLNLKLSSATSFDLDLPEIVSSGNGLIIYTGTTLGNVVTFSTSGILCAYGFDSGWGSIFYVTGALGVLWSMAWFYIAADNPSVHPRIVDSEKKYIVGSIEYRSDVRTVSVPWARMFKSPCLWACLSAHVCNNWTNYTLLTNIPTFMKEVLKFDIKSNGALSSIPYICQFLSAILAGQLADIIRTKQLLSTTRTRKTFQATAFLGTGSCIIATGFCTCENRAVAVVLLSMAVMFMGFGRAGYVVNHVDFAPKYAGVLFGITNTAATVPGMVAPLLAGYLTPNNTPEEWRQVFYVCGGFAMFGMLMFGIFASGDIQDWAKDANKEINVPATKEIEMIQTSEEKVREIDTHVKH